MSLIGFSKIDTFIKSKNEKLNTFSEYAFTEYRRQITEKFFNSSDSYKEDHPLGVFYHATNWEGVREAFKSIPYKDDIFFKEMEEFVSNVIRTIQVAYAF